MKEEFEYDDTFNYHKEKDFDAALSKYFPNGIDVYLDNVGGRMLEAVLNLVNKHAKIPLCGMISELSTIRCICKGSCWAHTWIVLGINFAKDMEGHLKQGKIGSKLKIFHGIDKFLESLEDLYSPAATLEK
ncbi:unnamed protein product [Prunus armeniaca]|uniref:Alcohol dehydrogenase-like C-terminal domain-containing protein n=1 Tax=Prunus armeniaca TaxID=36596 RepID=A0A6J5UDF5_PRUAR|nr:unnamed protein product [Prunus armeniaca]